MDPVTRIALAAIDKKRMIKVYSGAFGWQMQQLGP